MKKDEGTKQQKQKIKSLRKRLSSIEKTKKLGKKMSITEKVAKLGKQISKLVKQRQKATEELDAVRDWIEHKFDEKETELTNKLKAIQDGDDDSSQPSVNLLAAVEAAQNESVQSPAEKMGKGGPRRKGKGKVKKAKRTTAISDEEAS
jgi:hypothetical protein